MDRGRTADARPPGPAQRDSPFAAAVPDIAAPDLSLPRAGGAIRGIGEKFTANPATGTASVSVPVFTSPGRSGFGPQLSLGYDSGRGNGPCGSGWGLSLPTVTRRTDKGLPRYDDSDVFLLSDAEDLVPVLAPGSVGGDWAPVMEVDPAHAPGYRIDRYRPRVEGLFARIERWTRLADGDTHWRSVTRDNVASWYGLDSGSRIADPADPRRVFSWLLCRSEDGRGNAMSYEYLAESGAGVDLAQAHERHRTPADRTANRYVKRIRYGNRVSTLVDPDSADPGWMFEVVFDYGDHDEAVPTPVATRPIPCRTDPFSTYRAGFEVRTYRLCQRVLMFHHFAAEDGVGDGCLVRSTDLGHTPGDAVGTFLTSVTQRGYRRTGDRYLVRSLPPVEFGYTAALAPVVSEVDPDGVANLPAGLAAAEHRWADLDGEGIPGVLVTGTGAWHYKANLGGGRLGPLQPLPEAPSAAAGPPSRLRLLDLAGDGQLDVATFAGPVPGFIKRTTGGWLPWRPFTALPTVDFDGANARLVDLNGDGHADLLVAEDETLVWYPSLAEAGFGPGIRLTTAPDADAGPRLVFADRAGSLYLADISGDGLADLVRIRNGEVCYWPNMGYGRFGPKVTMDDAPWFDTAELFDQRNLRLTDVDGSGVVDLVYLAADGVRVHRNRSGNGWAPPVTLAGLPPVDPAGAVDTVDLLGTGTTCLVWSSTRNIDAGRSIRYADLTGGVKPHLLERMVNNLGAETLVRYAPSTRYHLADRAAGRPWLTRMPFPVQVVERVETYDQISRNRFVTRYAYHHGHFDGTDREFRGFGMTEQWDTEELSAVAEVDLSQVSNVDPVSHVPPVLTRTWFHTGAFLDLGPGLAAGYAAEYWPEPGLTDAEQEALRPGEPILPATLLLADGGRLPYRPATEELREACRALKGSPLRQEMYALDGSTIQNRPYQVVARTFAVELLQPTAGQLHTVCLTRPSETVTYHYERRLFDIEGSGGTTALADPRVSHELVLEVDGYGSVLRGVSVAYRRRYPDADLDPRLPAWAADAVTAAQGTTHALVTVNGFTNPVDEPADYRTPVPAQSRSFELAGISATGMTLFRLDALRALCDTAGSLRLTGHTRSLYRSDDLTGPLPLGQLPARGLPYQNYRLALTADLVESVYRLDDGVDQAVLQIEGGYLPGDAHRAAGLFPPDDPDGQWWVPSGQLHYAPEPDGPAAELIHALSHFFLPGRFTDPFGNSSTVHFDEYDLLTVQLRDPLGNLTTVGDRDPAGARAAGGHDYRVLAPRLVSDANRNRSAVAFDTLGMVTATAALGKPEELLGDSLVGLDPDPDDATVLAHLADPAADPHHLLAGAGTRLVYDLSAFSRDGQPPVVATLARETHLADLPAGGQSRVQQTFSYSDGFGRELQKKIPAEAGPLEPDGEPVAVRWVGSGWTVFDNKGQPVRQYEPFFSDTHRYEPDRAAGVTPVLCYDPAGRPVATAHPNHTWEKTVFDPWRQETWAVNDTVLIADPAADPDVGDHFRRLPDADYLPGWYAQRSTGGLGPHEQAAAVKAGAHAATPGVGYIDPLGRKVLTVAHNRFTRAGAPEEALHAVRVVLDIEGNEREAVDALGRLARRDDYDLLGNGIHSASMDAGERWTLIDVAGNVRYAWDSRDHRLRTEYDALGRPTGVYLRTGSAAERLISRTVYGESGPDPESHNLRGKPYQTFTGAGAASTVDFDFKGNGLVSEHQLVADYRNTPDWSAPVDLEPAVFTTRTGFDALNRAVASTLPDGSTIRPTYNEANLVEAIEANLRGETRDGQPVWTPFVTAIGYDAKGRRERISYANGATTTCRYDPLTARLTRLTTARGSEVLQDLSYTYDPAGNVTHLGDAAQQTAFFRNTVAEPSSDYIYDAVNQLIEATGREHLGQLAPDFSDGVHIGLPHPGDGTAMGRYQENYAYDPTGNLMEIRHTGSDPAHPGWTRTYTYAEPGNRLSSTRVGTGPTELYGYDAHGNLTVMPQLSQVTWNYADQLAAVSQQAVSDGTGEVTYYTYDASGQRVRAVTDHSSGAVRKKERIYLGGLEFYREYSPATGNATLERETLHIMDGPRRLALVETRTLGDDGSPAQLVRYQLDNHLGSASLELTGAGEVLSYEEYTPYGSTSYQAVDGAVHAAAKRYRYSGKERDEETGLVYYGARYYAPWLGRWCSADPAATQATNVYRGLGGNPVTRVDPDGREDVSWWKVGLNAAAFGVGAAAVGAGAEYLYNTHREEISAAVASARDVLSQVVEGAQRYQDAQPDTSAADYARGLFSSPMPSLLIHQASDEQLKQAIPGLQALESAGEFDQAMAQGDYATATESLLTMRSSTNQQMDRIAELATTFIPAGGADPPMAGRPTGAVRPPAGRAPAGGGAAGELSANRAITKTVPGYTVGPYKKPGSKDIEPGTSQLMLPFPDRLARRTVLSGHGHWDKRADGFFEVPAGTTLTVYTKKGQLMRNKLGQAIELDVDLTGVYQRTYRAGSLAPNLTLSPPTGLRLMGSPRTVSQPTLLQDLLTPNMGDVQWAACFDMR